MHSARRHIRTFLSHTLGRILRHPAVEERLDAYLKTRGLPAHFRLLSILYPRPYHRIARTPSGEITVDVSDMLGLALFYGRPTADKLELEIIERLVSPGDTCFDVGANIGLYTILMARAAGSRGYVHAFEPSPYTYAILSKNTALNLLENVILSHCAVSDNIGHAALFLTAESGLTSLGNTGRGTPLTSVNVPTITLDAYAAEHNVPNVQFLKIDVEGFEGSVLSGARGLLKSADPIIMIELDEKNFAALGFSRKTVCEELRALGFRGWSIDRRMRKLVSLDATRGVNCLFVKREGKQEKRVREKLADLLQ